MLTGDNRETTADISNLKLSATSKLWSKMHKINTGNCNIMQAYNAKSPQQLITALDFLNVQSFKFVRELNKEIMLYSTRFFK